MSRRILLIDADTEFRDTLTQQIGRYRVVVMTEPDSDRALALASSDPPDLIIIAVEEPE
jgi:DNA-binding response OmpR family regulator